MRRMKAGALAVAGWLVAAGAMGGSITSVTAPATATVGTPITITIQGTGPCGTLHVNYDTGQTAFSTVSAANFPFSPPPHVYGAPGVKTILVTALRNCTGTATATINVTSPTAPPPPPPGGGLVIPPSLRDLCARISCTPSTTTLSRPTLNEVLPASISPGSVLRIDGAFLGTTPGRVQVRLPDGIAASVTVAPPDWKPFSVTGTLDSSISGVRDGDAQIVIQRADNVLSNAMNVSFRATREVVQVTPPFVTVSACGDAAVVTLCEASNRLSPYRLDLAELFAGHLSHSSNRTDPSVSFDSDHANLWDDFGASGSDRYDLRLPDGWVLDSFHPGVISVVNATFHASTPSLGVRNATVIIDWRLGAGDAQISYAGWFFAAGPRGIPLSE